MTRIFRKNPDVEIPITLLHETEKAYLVSSEWAEKVWVPKSLVNDYTEEGGKIASIFLNEWVAKEKGLI